MPVQQIVVNPVTLQQTNNKDRKVSRSENTVIGLDSREEKSTCLHFYRTEFATTCSVRVWRLFIE